jgi:hypothetical protein
MTRGEPKEWRQGLDGYGLRLGSRLARSVVGNLVQHGGAAALGTDVRYLSSKSTNPWKRVGNAVFFEFFTRSRSGKIVFDLPNIGGIYVQEIVGSRWLPNRTITGYAVPNANQQIVQGIVSNVVREFLPDIVRVFRRKRSSQLQVADPPRTAPAN